MKLGHLLLLKARNTMRKLGLDVAPFPRLGKMEFHFPRYAVDVLIDAGANQGQYGLQAREAGFRGRIISFEPVKKTFAQLQQQAEGDPAWECINIALGETNERTTINISRDSVFNSLLDHSAFMDATFPQEAVIDKETIEVKRLDGMVEELHLADKSIWLKADTQGFDLFVVKGAESLLGQTKVIQVELSFRNIYVGQPPLEDVIRYLRSLGFVLADIVPVTSDAHGLIEADGIFLRKE